MYLFQVLCKVNQNLTRAFVFRCYFSRSVSLPLFSSTWFLHKRNQKISFHTSDLCLFHNGRERDLHSLILLPPSHNLTSTWSQVSFLPILPTTLAVCCFALHHFVSLLESKTELDIRSLYFEYLPLNTRKVCICSKKRSIYPYTRR